MFELPKMDKAQIAPHGTSVKIFLAVLSIRIVILLFSGVSSAFAQEVDSVRQWTDASGRFKVEATLVNAEGDSVELRTVTGQLLTVKASQLSDMDQAFLKKHAKTEAAEPFDFGLQAPARGRDGGSRMLSQTGRKLNLDGPEVWNVPADPAEGWRFQASDFEIPLPDKYSKFAVVKSAHSSHGIILTVDGISSQASSIDFSQTEPKLSGKFKLPLATPVCLSPSGSRLFMLNQSVANLSNSDVAVLDLNGGAASLRYRWNAFEGGRIDDPTSLDAFYLKTAEFANDHYLVTVHRGLCALWDVQRGELRWWTYTDYPLTGRGTIFGHSGAVLSPAGKQLFFQRDGFLIGVTVPEGRLIAKKKMELLPATALSISPDGKTMLMFSQVLRVISMESGEREADLDAEQIDVGIEWTYQDKAVHWINGRMFLLNTGRWYHLIDLNRKIEVRRFRFGEMMSSAPTFICDSRGGVAYPATDREIKTNSPRAGISRLDLSAEIAISETSEPPLYDLKPGDALGIDLHVVHNPLGGGSEDLSPLLRSYLERMLFNQGFEVRSDSPKRLSIHWAFTTKSVDLNEAFSSREDPSQVPTSRADSLSPTNNTNTSRLRSQRLPQETQQNEPRLSITTGFQSLNSGVFVDGKLILSVNKSVSLFPLELSVQEVAEVNARAVIIPQFHSVYRGKTTELGFGKQTEQTEQSEANPMLQPRSRIPNR